MKQTGRIQTALKRMLGQGEISCAEVAEVMQSYLDGEIGALEARRVSGHIERCAACGPEAAVFERIKASLRDRHGEPVDPESLSSLRDFADQVARGDVPRRDIE